LCLDDSNNGAILLFLVVLSVTPLFSPLAHPEKVPGLRQKSRASEGYVAFSTKLSTVTRVVTSLAFHKEGKGGEKIAFCLTPP
jgi:hypothetical protein